MNYYYPYYNMMPGANASPSLFKGLTGGIKGINWGTIIGNAQRTLGLINQAIPVVKQVTPVMRNAKTMFKVMNEFKKVDEPSKNKQVENNQKDNNTTISYNSNTNEPTFFI